MLTTEQIQILGAVISTTIIPATTKKFVVKDNFKVDISQESKIKISCLGDNFKEWFLEKNEESFAGSTVYGRKLDKDSIDGPILSELGGQKAETTMAEIYAMIGRQANGKRGDLLNNGWANIFYVRDITGILRAVGVLWVSDGWRIDAYSIKSSCGWYSGRQVFSHKAPEDSNSSVIKNLETPGDKAGFISNH